VNVPLAPELGLFLDKAFYDSYNTRWGNDREALDLDAFADQVAAFKARCRQGCTFLPHTRPLYPEASSWATVCPATGTTTRRKELLI